MQGGPFGENFFSEKKSRTAEKNDRGESLVSPGMVCYAEKQEKPFWFGSLDQIVHFDAIIFCRTFVELFWSVRVDRKQAGTGPSRRHIQGSKIAKRLPSVKYSFTVLENQNFLKKKFSKKLLKKWTKNLTMPKKTERGDPLGFFNIHSVAKHQKNAGGTLWGKILFFEKKVSQCRKKNERGESLVSPGMVWYAEKQEKPFLVQFARPNSAF